MLSHSLSTDKKKYKVRNNEKKAVRKGDGDGNEKRVRERRLEKGMEKNMPRLRRSYRERIIYLDCFEGQT